MTTVKTNRRLNKPAAFAAAILGLAAWRLVARKARIAKGRRKPPPKPTGSADGGHLI